MFYKTFSQITNYFYKKNAIINESHWTEYKMGKLSIQEPNQDSKTDKTKNSKKIHPYFNPKKKQRLEGKSETSTQAKKEVELIEIIENQQKTVTSQKNREEKQHQIEKIEKVSASKPSRKKKERPLITLDDSDEQKRPSVNETHKKMKQQFTRTSDNEDEQKSDSIQVQGSHSKQPIIDIEQVSYFIPVYKHKNYESHIKDVLKKLAGKTPDEVDLMEVTKAITYFREEFMVRRENKIIIKKNVRDTVFHIINNFHANLAKEVFPKVTKFILEKEHDAEMYVIPIFDANRELTQTLTKWQALFMMCCMTMCLIVQQKSDIIGKKHRFTHFIEFTSYFTSNEWKTRCILEYLRIELNNYYDQEPKPRSLNNRNLTIQRIICPLSLDKFLEQEKHKILIPMKMKNDDVTLDDFNKQLKLCHTNEVLGGGETLGGLSQEDIFFSAHPELHILLVLCQQMNPSDCINLVGFRKYFRVERSRYEISSFDGQDKDYPLDLDRQNRIMEYISFVSHPKIIREQFRRQFQKQNMDREIAIHYWAIKSFQQIPNVRFERVIAGHWACLIQWGDARKKIATLWMASSMNVKELSFCPYGQFKNIYDKDFFSKMREKDILYVYDRLLKAGRKMLNFRDNLFVYMQMDNLK